ncbi:hypothetical protein D3C73_1577720 [compost metagenome]
MQVDQSLLISFVRLLQLFSPALSVSQLWPECFQQFAISQDAQRAVNARETFLQRLQ